MPIGDPGKEQFRRSVVTIRNLHVAAGIQPLILLRQELLGNDELSDRGGMDDPTRDHLIELLWHADRWRRRVTHNPDKKNLGDQIQEALKITKGDGGKEAEKKDFTEADNPFGGDDIQNQSGGLIDLPFALDGSDPDIPVTSQLNIKSANALLLLGAVDRTIVNWTRLNSAMRTIFITRFDSKRIYGDYQAILGYLKAFAGDENRVDVAQLLPSQEPLGPDDSPNRKRESTGTQ